MNTMARPGSEVKMFDKAIEQENQNLCLLLTESARQFPYKRSIVVPVHKDDRGRYAYTYLTYEQLEKEVHRCAWGFDSVGIGDGDRVLVMITPGIDLVMVVFALFRVGAIPVFIDEGMGMENLLHCVEEVEPQAMVTIPRGLELYSRFPESFRTVTQTVVVGKNEGTHSLDDLRSGKSTPFPAAYKAPEDLIIILFTTGSTGTSKGVEYTPRVVRSQLKVMRETWGLTDQDVDLPIFPTFTIGTISIGMTVVVPDMNSAHPAQADPANIVQQINDNGVTYSFGSPALWDKVTRYCLEHDIQLPSVRNILIGGAPVPSSLIRRFPKILPNGCCNTPLGATEGNPLTNITSDELISETLPLTDQGKGICVGKLLPGHEVRVIEITDAPIPFWNQARLLEPGEVGELVVSGPVVTHRYFRRPEATKMAKIYDENGSIAHRLGDTGFIDEKGRVWFCGRRAHIAICRGQYWFPLQVESAFNSEMDIYRTALVNVEVNGEKELALCIEFESDAKIKSSQIPDGRLSELKARADHLNIPLSYFFACPNGFPVDIRHNAKINRPALSNWAKNLVDMEQHI